MAGVILRSSRFALMGAVLAFVAMFGLGALSVWHSTAINDADPVHAVSVEHSHQQSGQQDPDGPIHVAAHATGQWLAVAGQPVVPVFAILTDMDWSKFDPAWRSDLDPSKLLRPPKA